MKKHLQILMVAIFATLSLSLTSCGDDDKDSIVGTWVSPEPGSLSDGSSILVFDKNGSFTWDNHYIWADENGLYDEHESVSGRYSVAGDPVKGATVNMTGTDQDGDEVSLSVTVKLLDGGDVMNMTVPEGYNYNWYRK